MPIQILQSSRINAGNLRECLNNTENGRRARKDAGSYISVYPCALYESPGRSPHDISADRLLIAVGIHYIYMVRLLWMAMSSGSYIDSEIH
jgi:hypothetical protein